MHGAVVVVIVRWGSSATNSHTVMLLDVPLAVGMG